MITVQRAKPVIKIYVKQVKNVSVEQEIKSDQTIQMQTSILDLKYLELPIPI